MRHCLILAALFLSSCSPESVFVGPEVPADLVTPCRKPAPVKQETAGAMAELALGWKSTALCNESKLIGVAEIIRGPQ